MQRHAPDGADRADHPGQDRETAIFGWCCIRGPPLAVFVTEPARRDPESSIGLG